MEKDYEIRYRELEKKNWWFLGRKDLLRKFNRRLLFKGAKVLDVGCGSGENLLSLGLKDAYGIDFSKEAIAEGKKKGMKNLVRGSADKLPFKADTFDVVYCLDLIEHLDNDRNVVKEIERVLKPGGKALIMTPAFMFLWGDHDVVNHHKRRYTRKMLDSLIKMTKLRAVRWFYWNSFLFLPASAFKLLRKVKFNKSGAKSDHDTVMPGLVNGLLLSLLKTENSLTALGLKFPIGISIGVVVQK